MSTRLLLIASLVCAPSLPSQELPSTTARDAADFRGGWSGEDDEGAQRYAVPRIDPAGYRPVPMPSYRPVPLPEGFPHQPVSVDLRTGRETVHSAPPGPVIGLQEIGGWAPVGSGEPESWGNLSPINTPAFPWSTACRVFFTQGGQNWVCSGTMIDQRTVITAGHCVHQGPSGTWSTNVVVAPAWDGDSDAYGSANGISLGSWTTWTQGGSFDGDIGWIRLDRPFGALTSWFGYGYNTDDNFYRNTTFNMAGYPANAGCWTGAPNQLYYGSGLFDAVFARSLRANTPFWNCTVGGMSGTGCYYISGGSNRIVHGAQSNEATNFSDIGITRMIQGYFEHLRDAFIPGGFSTTQIDLVPLNVVVTTPAGGVRAGEAVTTMNYLVTNASLFDPPSATYSVSVYLSTNDNISPADVLLGTHTFTWDFGPKSSVRVNAPLPVIPASTIPGNYWIGIILNVADANTANNESDGWDAARVTVLPGRPVNDECAGALTITNGTNGPYVNTEATDSLPTWTCGSTASRDLWFRYTAPCSGVVTITTCGLSAFDTKLDVHAGTCGSLTLLACNDDSCGLQSRVTFVAISGTTYYVRGGGYAGSFGSFSLNVACQPFQNDECTGAVALNVGRNGPFTNAGSTFSPPPIPCGFNSGPDVWFSFSTPVPRNVQVNTCSSATNFDTVVQVFTGFCRSLTSLDCNDDSCGLQSVVNFQAAPGVTYYVRVGGYNNRVGTFELNVVTSTGFLTKRTGCGPTVLTATGNPVLGGAIGFQLSNLGFVPFLWFGAETSVPFCPSCILGATLGVTFVQAAIPSTTIPNDPALFGGQFAVQGADLLSPNGCASPMLTLTNTILVTIG